MAHPVLPILLRWWRRRLRERRLRRQVALRLLAIREDLAWRRDVADLRARFGRSG